MPFWTPIASSWKSVISLKASKPLQTSTVHLEVRVIISLPIFLTCTKLLRLCHGFSHITSRRMSKTSSVHVWHCPSCNTRRQGNISPFYLRTNGLFIACTGQESCQCMHGTLFTLTTFVHIRASHRSRLEIYHVSTCTNTRKFVQFLSKLMFVCVGAQSLSDQSCTCFCHRCGVVCLQVRTFTYSAQHEYFLQLRLLPPKSVELYNISQGLSMGSSLNIATLGSSFPFPRFSK